MGDDKGIDDEKPAHEVNLDAFYIGKYPVTNAEYARYKADQGKPYEIPSGKERHPVVNVDWNDARDVILLTALRTHEDWVRGIEAGADDFISKPFERDELLAKIRSLLRQKRHRDEHEKGLKNQLQNTMKDLEQVRIELARAQERIAMLERDKDQLSKFVPVSVHKMAGTGLESLGLQKVETDAYGSFSGHWRETRSGAGDRRIVRGAAI